MSTLKFNYEIDSSMKAGRCILQLQIGYSRFLNNKKNLIFKS